MAFTRFHDDPARIQKSLEQSTFSGRYHLDTPGPGTQLPYMADPQLRIQKWGANMVTDSTNLESELFCLGRPLSHNYDETYKSRDLFHGSKMVYPVSNDHVLESRASHPAWTFRDLEHSRWETPFINPLAHTDKEFTDNIQTRMLVKDQFVPILPDLSNMGNDFTNNRGLELLRK